MEAKDLAKQEVREALTSEITKEGLFELKEQTIRGNKYNVYTNAPKNLREFFQFGLPNLIQFSCQSPHRAGYTR